MKRRFVTDQAMDRLQLQTQAATMLRGCSTAEAMAAGWACRAALERGESPAHALAQAQAQARS